jgi:hypothetical protein
MRFCAYPDWLLAALACDGFGLVVGLAAFALLLVRHLSCPPLSFAPVFATSVDSRAPARASPAILASSWIRQRMGVAHRPSPDSEP